MGIMGAERETDGEGKKSKKGNEMQCPESNEQRSLKYIALDQILL